MFIQPIVESSILIHPTKLPELLCTHYRESCHTVILIPLQHTKIQNQTPLRRITAATAIPTMHQHPKRSKGWPCHDTNHGLYPARIPWHVMPDGKVLTPFFEELKAFWGARTLGVMICHDELWKATSCQPWVTTGTPLRSRLDPLHTRHRLTPSYINCSSLLEPRATVRSPIRSRDFFFTVGYLRTAPYFDLVRPPMF